MASPRPAKRVKLSAEETFEVRVSGQRFSRLNRQEFCRRSAYLQQRLQTAEARQSTLALEGLDPDDFDRYVQWVESSQENLPGFYKDDGGLLPLLRLYVVADRVCDLALANCVIDKIMQACKDARYWPSPKEITYIWGQNMSIPQTCRNPLRQLFIDIQIHNKEPFSLPSTDTVPIEYMRDIAYGFVDLVRSEGPRGEFQQDGDDIFKFSCYRREKCCYHQHDDDHPPCS